MAEQPVADNLWQEFDLGPDYHTPVEMDIPVGAVRANSTKVRKTRVIKCGCTPDRHLMWGHIGT